MGSEEEKIPFIYKDKLYFVAPGGKIYEKGGVKVENPSEELTEVSKLALESVKG